MKKIALLKFVIVLLVIAACTKKSSIKDSNVKPVDVKTLADYSNGADSPFIDIDSANKMLTSYLNSTATNQYEDELHSLIFDANALRYYLSNTSITEVKFMFAHRLDYINNGNQNTYAGNDYNAITMVIAGVDINGNYVYTTAGTVMDNAKPCPYTCPSTGTASSNLLPD